MRDRAWRFLRAFSQRSLARNADLTIEGIEHLPAEGPALLVVRHVHHQFDGEVLLAAIDRPVHLIVTSDWATNPASQRLLRFACRQADWPAVIREEAVERFGEDAARTTNARALRQSVRLLREGRIVAIFPQAYPLIDNNPRPPQLPDGELPFRPGVERLAQMATRAGIETPIVPVGLEYARGDRWTITARFGPAVEHPMLASDESVGELERHVRDLSGE